MKRRPTLGNMLVLSRTVNARHISLNSIQCNQLGRRRTPLDCQVEYSGVHHTKMFLIGYENGIRVIIHTANLCENDIHDKTQGAYIQDFPFKPDNSTEGSCQFQDDLIRYIDSYRFRLGHKWDGNIFTSLTRALRRYDFTSAQVVLIPSIPGKHSLSRPPLGLLKLRDAIRDHASSSGASSGHVVCQFSSIGSLSVNWLNHFLSSTCLGDPRTTSSRKTLAERIKLVYPTVEEICNSVEGYSGGGSVPGSTKNVKRDFLLPLYCKWSSSSSDGNPFQKSRNVPHIKSYYQLSSSNTSMKWFVLGSHNISKAAWGDVEYGHDGSQNHIRSWELGVFFSPELMCSGPEGGFVPYDDTNTAISGSSIRIPLPYALVPEPYGPDDETWTVDDGSVPDGALGQLMASGPPGQMGPDECAIQ